MIGKTLARTVEIFRDIYHYPCFSCEHREPHFCILHGGKCANLTVRFRGVYPDYESAVAALPTGKPHGFNSDEVAGYFSEHHSTFNSNDYPVLLRLAQHLRPGARVFDLGGGSGQCYHAYSKQLVMPPGLTWQVCDVESFVHAGREFAEKQGVEALAFTTDWRQANSALICVANGALQYIEPDLSDLLRELPDKPAHVLVNRTPLCAGKPYYTVQYGAFTYCPYKIMNFESFVHGMEEAGYRLADQWTLPRTLRIPLHSGHAAEAYYGFYFHRAD